MANSQFNIIVLGDSYARKEESLFLSDVNIIQRALLDRPPYRQRSAQIAFHTLSWTGKYQCTPSTFWEGSTCNETKVMADVKASGPPYDLVVVLAKNISGGGGGAITIVGSTFHDEQRMGSIFAHEAGHSIGGFHENSGGIMSATCNQGACGYTETYTPAQQDAINAILDAKVGPLNDIQAPVLGPIVVGATSSSKNFVIQTTASIDTMRVELWIDQVNVQTHPFWDRNIFANSKDGIKFYYSFSSGHHEVKIKAIDAKYNESFKIVFVDVP